MKPSKRRDLLIEHADKARLSRELVTAARRCAVAVAAGGAAAARRRTGRMLAAWLTQAGFPQHRSRGWGWTAGRRPPAARRRGSRRSRRQSDLAAGAAAGAMARGRSDHMRPLRRPTRCAPGLPRHGARHGGAGYRDRRAGSRCAPRLVGFSLATAPGRACYVPLRHTVLGEQIALADAIACWRRY